MLISEPDTDGPLRSVADPRELLDTYLDAYRARLLRKLEGLSDDDLRRSRLPSGWTPLELVVHLTFVERRWLEWGFLGEPVDEPWGDNGPDGTWRVPDGRSADDVIAGLAERRARSRAIVAGVPLDRRARPGGRFATENECPTLAWILFHLLQEYARHVGQLDVARELIDGAVGE